jgi:hypothetical protein
MGYATKIAADFNNFTADKSFLFALQKPQLTPQF